jgi:NADPH-dependent glutamate synthase beta subunit-like oxidoreductase
MRHIVIVGSGPAGYYAAEACQKLFGEEARIDIIDRLPVPYGLIRFGVAPDHQSIKAVSRRYEGISLADTVRFIGNVTVGVDVSVAELQNLYDAVIFATGAPDDNPLEIRGADLPGVYGSAAFVGWYNGHPDFADLAPVLDTPGAVVIGNGNVALDVARILAKTRGEFAGSDIVNHALDRLETSAITQISILGRRGPHQLAMTPKELGELGHLARATPLVDPADLPPEADDAGLEPGVRKSVTHLRSFARGETEPKIVTVNFDFFAKPVAIEGEGRVERIIVERTVLDADSRAVGTGETYTIACGLVVACIGYQTPPLDGVAYEAGRGRFANIDGRIAPGLYCVGWARRGPSGTIGTNRPDSYAVIDLVAQDIGAGAGKRGYDGLAKLMRQRGIEVVLFSDWQKIDAAETARARADAPREKFVNIADMLSVLG